MKSRCMLHTSCINLIYVLFWGSYNLALNELLSSFISQALLDVLLPLICTNDKYYPRNFKLFNDEAKVMNRPECLAQLSWGLKRDIA